MPMIAGLSAAHLAAIRFPEPLRRLYVARDNDPRPGPGALKTLSSAAEPLGIADRPARSAARTISTAISARTGRARNGGSASRPDAAARCGALPYAEKHSGISASVGAASSGARPALPLNHPGSRASGLRWRATAAADPGIAMAGCTAIFRRGCAPLCIAKQNSLQPRHPPLALRPRVPAAVRTRTRRREGVAAKAARGAATRTEAPHDRPVRLLRTRRARRARRQRISPPGDAALRPSPLRGRTRPRGRFPMTGSPAAPSPTSSTRSPAVSSRRGSSPISKICSGASSISSTAPATRIEREPRSQRGRRSVELQREQDGSEIRSVELERAVAEGITLIERRDTMEFFRECAADQLSHPSPARPGSRAPDRASAIRSMTAAMIDSRDFMDRRLREKAKALIPEGTRIAFSGGAVMQRSSAYLVGARQGSCPSCRHGPAPRRDADRRRARRRLLGRRPQACRRWPSAPTGTATGRRLPSSATSGMIDAMPAGLIVFSGTGIQDNLVDKAASIRHSGLGFPHPRGAMRCRSGPDHACHRASL